MISINQKGKGEKLSPHCNMANTYTKSQLDQGWTTFKSLGFVQVCDSWEFND